MKKRSLILLITIFSVSTSQGQDSSLLNLVIGRTECSHINNKLGTEHSLKFARYKDFQMVPSHNILYNGNNLITLYKGMGTRKYSKSNYGKIEFVEVTKWNGKKYNWIGTMLINQKRAKTNQGVLLGITIGEFHNIIGNQIFTSMQKLNSDYWLFEICHDKNEMSEPVQSTTKSLQPYLQDGEQDLVFQHWVLRPKYGYRARYIFKNNVLVKFGFGYSYEFPTGDLEGLEY